MQYVLSNREMREADAYTIHTLGVPSLTLMERAGRALATEAAVLAPKGKILCVCGGGNNGGDGFVCARILRAQGREAETVFFAEKISEDCRINKEKWESEGGVVLPAIPENGGYALIVDCLVGTGLRGALNGKNADTVSAMNAQKQKGVKILAADIPSGLCGENGYAEGEAVRANETLCIGEIKAGALLADGLDYAGVIKRADIGIVLPEKQGYAVHTDRETAVTLLPKRKRNSNKGTYGRAAIMAGSAEYTGAAYLSAAACLHSGAGYTTLFLPAEILPYYVLKAPEILLKASNEGGRYAFNEKIMSELLSYDSVAYGMGMGVSEEVAKGAAYLVKTYTGRLILDADALNSLAYYRQDLQEIFSEKKCDVVLTPHIKEFSRLSGIGTEDIVKEGMYVARAFAKAHGVTVLLKNASSVITDGNRTAVNTTGCSGQAKGGSGDVLAGVLAGLCAMGAFAFDGARLGAYIAGRAAEIAVEHTGEYSLTATESIANLGRAFQELLVAENADKNRG